jgi:hypothetical protein
VRFRRLFQSVRGSPPSSPEVHWFAASLANKWRTSVTPYGPLGAGLRSGRHRTMRDARGRVRVIAEVRSGRLSGCRSCCKPASAPSLTISASSPESRPRLVTASSRADPFSDSRRAGSRSLLGAYGCLGRNSGTPKVGHRDTCDPRCPKAARS